MSDENLYLEILKQLGVEYAASDPTGRIYDYSPGITTLINGGSNSLLDHPLERLFDELVGSEADLEKVRWGELPALKIEKIIRTFADNREGYLNIIVTPYAEGGLLLIANDITTEARLEQRITQQRNELHLLAHELASTQLKLDDLLRRFVPGSVADELIANPNAIRPGGEKREVTILFADLQGFTHWMETQEGLEEGFWLLSNKLATAAEAILEENGILDKYLGDAVMGIFNAPRPDEQHTLHAIRAAWRITQRLSDDSNLQFRVGINRGQAVVGNIGTPQALNYTAIGDAVNRAKRLQEMAKPGQILVSGSSLEHLPGKVTTRSLGMQPLRGKTRPVEVFEIIGLGS